MADHLSKLVIDEVSSTPDIDNSFPDDQLMNLAAIDETPWFADIANYLASGIVPTGRFAHKSSAIGMTHCCSSLVQTACCIIAFPRLRYILS